MDIIWEQLCESNMEAHACSVLKALSSHLFLTPSEAGYWVGWALDLAELSSVPRRVQHRPFIMQGDMLS